MHSDLPIIKTNRLLLRPLTVNDDAFILRLLNTPGWLEFIGDRNVHDSAAAIAYIENGPLRSYSENGHGLYAVELAEEKQSIGLCGLLQRPHWQEVDLGFAFLPEFTGKGYAQEAAEAVLTDGKERLHLKSIVAITLVSNAASIRLLQKIGMKPEGRITDPATGEELLLFRS